MIERIHKLYEKYDGAVQVGVAILFEDGACFVRRWDTEQSRLFENMEAAMSEHQDCRLSDQGVLKGPSSEDVQDAISKVCSELERMLTEKNKAYGNSVLDPVRIFSKATAIEGALVRVDDKLSRLCRGYEYPGDDTVRDLIGYLILILVGRRLGIE